MSNPSFLPICPELLVAHVCAAAVRPNFDFERSCRLVLQQMFHVQSFNTALRDRLGLSAEDSDTVACVTDH